jgi:hypothetical protein
MWSLTESCSAGRRGNRLVAEVLGGTVCIEGSECLCSLIALYVSSRSQGPGLLPRIETVYLEILCLVPTNLWQCHVPQREAAKEAKDSPGMDFGSG